ncbi:adenylate/guanylate cyclase domain-containing protein [Alteromonas lipolytica]|uniref:adenylate cyclase n=1 Tax=Alteromonas lipolytica TaxID=1856405 RepID=A0A1E8FGA4_9ALTE|nr:adenylate/guanylate cyclase domain-containing protein [Alteromonas lipolytica]OFI34975.1 hypothetical protein BFC17_15545 [Alteromonas lipolytica]GGF55549.1 hypothetical protein GCM10011338_04760 [Alteromonas lipolytica]
MPILTTTLPPSQQTITQVRTTLKLTLQVFFFALLLQLPALWYFASLFSAQSINWLLHTAGLLLLVIGQHRLPLNQFKVLLFAFYYSYLTWVLLLWPGLSNTHYFYLLAVVIAGFVFTRNEKLNQMIILSGAIFLFCLFSVSHYQPHTPFGLLQLSNDLTLGALSVGIYFLLRRQALQRWSGLKGAHLQSLQTLNQLLPPNPERPNEYWQPGTTRCFSQVSVLFADLHGYTALNRQFGDAQTVSALASLYAAIDKLTEHYPVQKIKTNGDQYIAVSGLQAQSNQHYCTTLYQFACALHGIIRRFSKAHDLPCTVRIGIATGRVTAGIIGKNRPYFDIWGDTVNRAAYLEQVSATGKISVCPLTASLLPEGFVASQRALNSAKHPDLTHYFELSGQRKIQRFSFETR